MSNSSGKQAQCKGPLPEQRLSAFIALGRAISDIALSLGEGHPPDSPLKAARTLYDTALNSPGHNPWFTLSQVRQSLAALGYMLREESLRKWLDVYPRFHLDNTNPSNILVVMAGNIPLVGFHDFLSVLISGHRLTAKLSSQDQELPRVMAQLLSEIAPEFAPMMSFHTGRLPAFDAVIATGSDNSSRYFQHYFGHIPHLIRKNRTSIGILDGTESPGELQKLGADVFSYHGKGCRNVSQLWLPAGYPLEALGHAWTSYAAETAHHKYRNNYLYHKAMFLAGNIAHTDTGFCLLKEDIQVVSPLAVLHIQYYEHPEQLKEFISAHQEVIQAVIAHDSIFRGSLSTIPPGKGQWPEPWDYADGTDTLNFLLGL